MHSINESFIQLGIKVIAKDEHDLLLWNIIFGLALNLWYLDKNQFHIQCDYNVIHK